ncbi:putative metal-dependent hydrolase [Flavobacterium amnicola]|uniref:Putative metal-dependent hydrolase n=1 Tax=Flavobacterium amnicola TaxID=2506422 RepID=A0A4Q1K5G0_9FLAO|nr:putative metal-dependent hydrolase [Flavobacterium amnicola]RXR21146.1 putative metal-dependent hydrolase [Flavobacterium amnicola]
MNIEKLRFPIGPFHFNPDVTTTEFENWKMTIKNFPQKIKEVVATLSTEELQWRYRPEGWKIKQVVHHCADSHMNALIRVKLTLTEESPTIRPYEEQLWAELEDGLSDDLGASIQILEGVHHRWSTVIDSLQPKDWEKMYFHPASQKLFTLKEMLGLYAWHCEHHLAHIYQALHYKGEF